MAPHGHFPRTNNPEQIYDWAAPYDWAVEGVFDEPETTPEAAEPSPLRKSMLALRASVIMMASVVVIELAAAGVVEVVRKEFSTAASAKDIPANLPRPVRLKADSAVKVMYGMDSSRAASGSGAKIGSDIVLTAGHLVLEDDPHMNLDCEGSYALNVNTPGVQEGDGVTGRKAIFDSSGDVAVLSVRTGIFDNYAFDSLPTARIAADQPDKGDPVFFVNYGVGQAQGSLSERYPNDILAKFPTDAAGRSYGHPAEYAGTVVGHAGPDLVVATGQRSYGPKAGREFNTHLGASGGPVFNQDGEIVGEAVVIKDYKESVDSVNSDFDINLPPTPKFRHLVYVQSVTKDIVRPLIRDLRKDPNC